MAVEYKTDDVLTAARKRIARVFNDFEEIVISVSGGKDSTVLAELCAEEAARRSRRPALFFLDQEAEYESTIDVIEALMADPRIEPRWYQVPLLMTNATSHRALFLRAWEPGEAWMRAKHPAAIHAIEGDYPRRFYDFFPWHEAQATRRTAYFVGLRSKESLNRFRAVTKAGGHDGLSWSTVTKNPNAVRFYPLYDWTFGDIWKYIAEAGLRYNTLYDKLFAKHGANISLMRVSNLIHEKSFRCLADLQEFEPATYEALVRRLPGIHAAGLYAKDVNVYGADSLPPSFTSWRHYRDYLIATTPTEKLGRFRGRFAKQGDDEDVCQGQVKQLLMNDWENNVPVALNRRAALRQKWWDRL